MTQKEWGLHLAEKLSEEGHGEILDLLDGEVIGEGEEMNTIDPPDFVSAVPRLVSDIKALHAMFSPETPP